MKIIKILLFVTIIMCVTTSCEKDPLGVLVSKELKKVCEDEGVEIIGCNLNGQYWVYYDAFKFDKNFLYLKPSKLDYSWNQGLNLDLLIRYEILTKSRQDGKQFKCMKLYFDNDDALISDMYF
ncbi:MAG: hypothetical protein RR442_09405 [Muribaculaceae bacterium]